jgi:hypothetical protein
VTRTTERARFLSDIVVGAVEGGTGYWACVSRYRNSDETDTRAVLHELNDDCDGYVETGVELNVDVVATGIGRIVRGDVGVRSDLRTTITQASRENDAGDIDAEGADVIAQAGLLGEIRYG